MKVEDLKPGERLGRYRLGTELGRGAMGLVFLAEDTLLKQQLCIKVLHPALANHPEAVERFNREIVLARRIAHKGVCRLFDLHEENGLRFITMEVAEGLPLRDLLTNDAPPMTAARTIAIGRNICEALAAAHAVDIVHRDLKPRNIMVRDDDEVTLLDFGIARALDQGSSLTLPGVALGTRHYIAPEVWAGRPATPKADQFSVGVILYNCLTGKMPFAAPKEILLLESMSKGPPPPPSAVRPGAPVALDAVVLKALAFKPEDRYPDVLALAKALGEVGKRMANLVTTVPGPRTPTLPPRPAPQPPPPVLVATAPNTFAFEAAPTVVNQGPITLPPSVASTARTDERGPNVGNDRTLVNDRTVVNGAPATAPQPAPLAARDTQEVPQPYFPPQAPRQAAPAVHAQAATAQSAAGPSVALADDASWVVGGRAVDLPAIPKNIAEKEVDETGAPVQPAVRVIEEEAEAPTLPQARKMSFLGMVMVTLVVFAAAGIGMAAMSGMFSKGGEPRPPDENAPHPSDPGPEPSGSGTAPTPSPTPVPTPTPTPDTPTPDAAAIPDDEPQPAPDEHGQRKPLSGDQKRFVDERNNLEKAATNKGLLAGDDPDLDRARAAIQQAAKAHKWGDAASLAADAKKHVNTFSINSAFVKKKLVRFNDRFDAASTADTAAKARLDTISGQVLKQMRDGKLEDANKTLNDGFAALARIH